MQKSINLSIYILLSIFIITSQGCKNSQVNLTENEKSIIVDEIKMWMQEVDEAENSFDLDRVLDLYANIEDFVYCSNGKIISDYSKFKNNLKRFLQQSVKYLNSNINNENIAVLSKEAAAFSFSFDWSLLTLKGDTLNCRGSWTYVLKKYGGIWKSVHCNGTHNYY